MSLPYTNRELSWLEFNQRVLEQAQDTSLPLLERLKFLAITASNLDEFFMVRVGGLALLRRSGIRSKEPSGLTPTQQLTAINKRASRFIEDQYTLLTKELLPNLIEVHLAPSIINDLSQEDQNSLQIYFQENIFPLLTPLAVEGTLAPYIPTLKQIIAVELKDEETLNKRLVLVPIPDSLPRRIPIPNAEGYVLNEQLVMQGIPSLFPGESPTSMGIFRLTRNGDITVQEDETGDLAEEMEEVLIERRFSDCVRLELSEITPIPLATTIKKLVNLQSAKCYRLPHSLDLSWLMDLATAPGNDEYKAPSWSPSPSSQIDPERSLFANIRQGDIILYHPYESYDPVVHFIEEAAKDPKVIAIKQVLYRTARNSRIIAALIEAAKNGKQVTALVELKARFDEARNLDRAEDLQRAGVHVVYGVKGLKTHAKICLVVRKENGHIARYCHFGTGNYNESTARLYTDISLLTCQPDFGMDASLFFNSVTGRSKIHQFAHLVPSPFKMKKRLLELIENETQRAKQGSEALIMAKMNSLQDLEMIEALYHAAEAGVKIKLNIRGICCLQPGEQKGHKNIKIISIIDTYLEHARIFYFHQGGESKVFMASADWMTRNLDKRVELMIPVLDPKAKTRLTHILEICLKDNTQSWQILPDGTSKRLRSSENKQIRSQELFTKEAKHLAKVKESERLMTLTPLTPSEINN